MAAGAAKMPPKRVVKNQLWSSLVWICVFGGLGYLFSSAVNSITHDLKVLGLVLIIILAISIAISRLMDYIIDKIYP
jgi:membrane protein DedA with SNARE-associated domain